jgi:AcrR family transcriptional regulator
MDRTNKVSIMGKKRWIVKKKSNINNRKVKRTRSWIFEALMLLMDEKPYNEINVSDIVKKAGIARQTFYGSYNNKDDVILQFFEQQFYPDMVKVNNVLREGERDIFEIAIPLGRAIKHAGVLKKILNSDAEYLCYASAKKNQKSIKGLYAEKVPKDIQIIFSYIINYQNYSITRLICDWIKDDMPVPVETIIGLIRKMTAPFDMPEYAAFNTTIPHVVLNIQTKE